MSASACDLLWMITNDQFHCFNPFGWKLPEADLNNARKHDYSIGSCGLLPHSAQEPS